MPPRAKRRSAPFPSSCCFEALVKRNYLALNLHSLSSPSEPDINLHRSNYMHKWQLGQAYSPLLHDRHSVTQGFCFLYIVSDEYHCRVKLPLDQVQLAAKFLPQPGVDTAQRLVKQQHIWLKHEYPAERNSLLLSAGKLCRKPVKLTIEAQ